VVAGLADIPLIELRDRMGRADSYDLGVLSGIEARRVDAAGKSHGLDVERKHASNDSYGFFDRTMNIVWIVENENEAQRVALEMIEAGVPLELVEVD
jgi:hypothetical protein